VVRVAGNVTDPVVIGSVEYAVDHLHVPLIVVLGHESCGAVAAALTTGRPEGNRGAVIERVHVGKGLPKDRKAALAQAVRANARYQAAELTKQSKVLRAAVAAGRVRSVTGIKDLETGQVHWLDSPAPAVQSSP
jgi:carbonic anhydrase